MGSALPMSRDGHGGLDVSSEQPSDDTVHIRVVGELDMSNRDALTDALMSARARASTLVVDLRSLAFMDSSGLRVLLDLWNETSMAERDLKIVVPKDGVVRRVLEISGCDRMLPIVEDPDGF